MMDSLDSFMHTRPPTAARPLLGLTVLVVEDSRFASEAMRLLCLRSGARIRRADTLASAHRHLKVYCPSVVIVDIGLPDGSGTALIRELALSRTRVDVVLGTSADPDGEARAIKAGADGFLAKPLTSLAYFQTAILSHLPAERQPGGLRAMTDDVVEPDAVALRDDLTTAAMVLQGALDGTLEGGKDARSLRYLTQFLGGLARAAQDARLERETAALAALQSGGAASGGSGVRGQVARIAALIEDRITRTAAI